MLIFDFHKIGGKLFAARKRLGLTQMEVAEAVNMRVETVLRICQALHVSPNEILTDDDTSLALQESELLERLARCTTRERETALSLLAVYLQSLR